MRLVIAEKPSVARGIADALGARTRKDGYIEGAGYVVSWCRGHLVDFDYPDAYEQWSGDWELSQLPMLPSIWQWHVDEKGADQFHVLSSLMARADVDEIVNACDADREGEGIFRRVYDYVCCDKPVVRFWSTSLVPEQVLADLESARPMSDYDGLAASAVGRAKADWLVGMNASRALSCLYKGARLSAGRVQTPTLALVVERTRAVERFESRPFFQAVLGLGGFEVFGERLSGREEAASRADAARGARARVVSVERKRERNRAPRLYDLTSLQRDASTRAGLTAEATLNALQSLYEKKIATYPRTESRFIGEGDVPEAEAVLAQVSAAEIVGEEAAAAFDPSRADVSRTADDGRVHGHGAILPTRLLTAEAMAGLSGDELAVARLICCRLLAATMEPAERLRTRLSCECGGHEYSASGNVVTDASWIAVDDAARALVGGRREDAGDADPDQPIPDGISEGDELAVASARVKDGKTSPPRPYTDATLLSAMEHAGRSIEDADLKAAIEDDSMHSGGLGTPATRAATIEELFERGYCKRKGRSILATERGCSLVDVVCDSLKTPELTARWELELSRVERGEATLDGFLKGIEGYAAEVVSALSSGFDADKSASVTGRAVVGSCPACGAPVQATSTGKQYRCTASSWAGKEGGFALVSGDGFRLNAAQCGKRLTEKQVRSLVAGERVRVSGLKRKDGSTFEAECEFTRPDSWRTGFVDFVRGEGRGGGNGARGSRRPGGPKRRRG